jgi:hypothetical protein
MTVTVFWRLEISDGTNAYSTSTEDGHFLTVLFPTAVAGAAAPTVYAIGSATSGDHIGVEIDAPSGDDILVVFSNDVTDATHSTFTVSVNLDTPHDVVVADLSPGLYSVGSEVGIMADNNSVFADGVVLDGSVLISLSGSSQSGVTMSGVTIGQ